MENEDYNIDAFETELLDAYFKFRSNLPMKDEGPDLNTRRVSRPRRISSAS